MIPPIITFVIAGGVTFLAWKTSTIETDMPNAAPVAVEAPAEDEVAEEEPAEEPAEDTESSEDSE